jgi:hypothetical protein
MLRPPHLVPRRNAIRVDVQPHRQLRPDGVRPRDHAVIVAAEQRPIVLRERDEPVGGRAAFEQRCAHAEELGTVVDQAIAIAVERQERLVTASTHPLHEVRRAVGIDVEPYAAARGTKIDAVAARVDDNRTALSPDVAGEQAQKQADERFHGNPFLLQVSQAVTESHTWACSIASASTGRCRSAWHRRQTALPPE